jgi:adenylate cyclase
MAGRNEEALAAARRAIQEMPNSLPSYRFSIVAEIRLGHMEQARLAAARILELDPGFSIATRLPSFRDADFDAGYRAALRAAGLPD